MYNQQQSEQSVPLHFLLTITYSSVLYCCFRSGVWMLRETMKSSHMVAGNGSKLKRKKGKKKEKRFVAFLCCGQIPTVRQFGIVDYIDIRCRVQHICGRTEKEMMDGRSVYVNLLRFTSCAERSYKCIVTSRDCSK